MSVVSFNRSVKFICCATLSKIGDMVMVLHQILNSLTGFSLYFYTLVVPISLYTKNWILGISSLIAWTALIHREELKIHLRTLPRDIRFLKRTIKLFSAMAIFVYFKKSYITEFQARVKKHPNKIALIHKNDYWTFQEVDEYSNRVANYFKRRVNEGDTVALYLQNKPEFLCIWLGLAKIRVITALINTNQRLDPLLHSFNVVNVKAIIYGSELTEGIEEIKDKIVDKPLYVLKNKYEDEYKFVDGSLNLEEELQKSPKTSPTEYIKKISPLDNMLYIYTSGTTGLPKAAIVNHNRAYMMAMAMKYYLLIKDEDVVYTVLPLYHSAGGLLGSGQSLVGGSTQVINTKLSVTSFWHDCIKYECTVAQYIGEICRYLLASPTVPEERLHRVRLMYGNGLREQIWDQFVQRFGIQQIGEIYGSTEGNANMLNTTSKPGSCGCVPWFCRPIFPIFLIKADPKTNEPIRDENGFCIPCKPGEAGLLIGKIKDAKRAIGSFEGYTDKKASNNKILVNVFKKGDRAFNTGDVLVRDEENYYYFKDRTGDTFRWKGENVSTCEVEAVISNIVQLKDAVAYGVLIPNVEGRAGMVAIANEDNQINLDKLAEEIKKALPQYARPIFVRLLTKVNLTGTFKLQKTDLQNDGFDPNKISDPLYYMDTFGQYVPLTAEIYEEIINGKRKM